MRSRRAGIIQAARSVFVQKGYSQASMSDVIEAAGLSVGAIYNHFTGKAELLWLLQPASTSQILMWKATSYPGTMWSGACEY